MSSRSAFDVSQIDGIISDIEKLGDSLNQVVEESLTKSARKASERLQGAVSNTSSYPAGGKYSMGLTQGMVRRPEFIWTSPTTGFIRWGIDTKTYGEPYRVPVYVAYGVKSKFDGVSSIRRAIFSASILAEFQDKVIEDVEREISRV